MGKCEADIRSSYRGGPVYLFKPILKQGFIYDMNSQYPAAMLKDMPTGKPVHCFKPEFNNFFGFLCAYVITPKYMKKPFLTTLVDGKVVAPLGRWKA